MQKNMDDPLVSNFVRLCTNSILSFKGSAMDSIDTLHGHIVLGEQLLGSYHRGGWAATETGTLSGVLVSEKPQDVPAGAVIMLPKAEEAGQFTSVFYITTQKQTIYEGELIGTIEKGLEELQKLASDFGTKSGIPEKTILVHECGRI